jgi:hypothetical protein
MLYTQYAEFNSSYSPSFLAQLESETSSPAGTPDASKLALLKEKMKVKTKRRFVHFGQVGIDL